MRITLQALGQNPAILGAPLLAFLPAVTLAAYQIGGEPALIGTAILVPLLFAIVAVFLTVSPQVPQGEPAMHTTHRNAFLETMDTALRPEDGSPKLVLCLTAVLENFQKIEERYGRQIGDRVLSTAAIRISDTLVGCDATAQIDPTTLGCVFTHYKRCDLETALQQASRLQTVLQRPMVFDGAKVQLVVSVGFSLSSQLPEANAGDLLDAALMAMVEARRDGPAAIRAHTDDLRQRIETRKAMIDEVAQALDHGEIQPWFQPQISTETGQIAGFEVLARWKHPKRGLVPPAEFLPAIEQAGLLEQLGDHMLGHALSALQAWDRAGVHVPQIGVNFSPQDLANPHLADKINWELERFDMAPQRLAVEVLESVVATSSNDAVTRNLADLADLGCGIDLDDFGTGYASISSIRQFSINRIKIDRSFVAKIDKEPDQQNLLAAILILADRLGLETLAEGVETLGEHAVLSQLGCGYVQGYGLARPMPFGDTIKWIERHTQKVDGMIQIAQHQSGKML